MLAVHAMRIAPAQAVVPRVAMAKRAQSLSSATMALPMRVVAATLIAPLLARVLPVATVSSVQN